LLQVISGADTVFEQEKARNFADMLYVAGSLGLKDNQEIIESENAKKEEGEEKTTSDKINAQLKKVLEFLVKNSADKAYDTMKKQKIVEGIIEQRENRRLMAIADKNLADKREKAKANNTHNYYKETVNALVDNIGNTPPQAWISTTELKDDQKLLGRVIDSAGIKDKDIDISSILSKIQTSLRNVIKEALSDKQEHRKELYYETIYNILTKAVSWEEKIHQIQQLAKLSRDYEEAYDYSDKELKKVLEGRFPEDFIREAADAGNGQTDKINDIFMLVRELLRLKYKSGKVQGDISLSEHEKYYYEIANEMIDGKVTEIINKLRQNIPALNIVLLKELKDFSKTFDKLSVLKEVIKQRQASLGLSGLSDVVVLYRNNFGELFKALGIENDLRQGAAEKLELVNRLITAISLKASGLLPYGVKISQIDSFGEATEAMKGEIRKAIQDILRNGWQSVIQETLARVMSSHREVGRSWTDAQIREALEKVAQWFITGKVNIYLAAADIDTVKLIDRTKENKGYEVWVPLNRFENYLGEKFGFKGRPLANKAEVRHEILGHLFGVALDIPLGESRDSLKGYNLTEWFALTFSVIDILERAKNGGIMTPDEATYVKMHTGVNPMSYAQRAYHYLFRKGSPFYETDAANEFMRGFYAAYYNGDTAALAHFRDKFLKGFGQKGIVAAINKFIANKNTKGENRLLNIIQNLTQAGLGTLVFREYRKLSEKTRNTLAKGGGSVSISEEWLVPEAPALSALYPRSYFSSFYPDKSIDKMGFILESKKSVNGGPPLPPDYYFRWNLFNHLKDALPRIDSRNRVGVGHFVINGQNRHDIESFMKKKYGIPYINFDAYTMEFAENKSLLRPGVFLIDASDTEHPTTKAIVTFEHDGAEANIRYYYAEGEGKGKQQELAQLINDIEQFAKENQLDYLLKLIDRVRTQYDNPSRYFREIRYSGLNDAEKKEALLGLIYRIGKSPDYNIAGQVLKDIESVIKNDDLSDINVLDKLEEKFALMKDNFGVGVEFYGQLSPFVLSPYLAFDYFKDNGILTKAAEELLGNKQALEKFNNLTPFKNLRNSVHAQPASSTPLDSSSTPLRTQEQGLPISIPTQRPAMPFGAFPLGSLIGTWTGARQVLNNIIVSISERYSASMAVGQLTAFKNSIMGTQFAGQAGGVNLAARVAPLFAVVGEIIAQIKQVVLETLRNIGAVVVCYSKTEPVVEASSALIVDTDLASNSLRSEETVSIMGSSSLPENNLYQAGDSQSVFAGFIVRTSDAESLTSNSLVPTQQISSSPAFSKNELIKIWDTLWKYKAQLIYRIITEKHKIEVTGFHQGAYNLFILQKYTEENAWMHADSFVARHEIMKQITLIDWNYTAEPDRQSINSSEALLRNLAAEDTSDDILKVTDPKVLEDKLNAGIKALALLLVAYPDLNTAYENIEKKENRLQKLVEEAIEDMKEGRIAELEAKMAQILGLMEELGTRLDGLQTDLNTLKTDFDTLKTDFDTQKTDTNDRLANFGKKIDLALENSELAVEGFKEYIDTDARKIGDMSKETKDHCLPSSVKALNRELGEKVENGVIALRGEGKEVSLEEALDITEGELGVYLFSEKELRDMPADLLKQLIILKRTGDGKYHAFRVFRVNDQGVRVFIEDSVHGHADAGRTIPWAKLGRLQSTKEIIVLCLTKIEGKIMNKGARKPTSEELKDLLQEVRDINGEGEGSGTNDGSGGDNNPGPPGGGDGDGNPGSSGSPIGAGNPPVPTIASLLKSTFYSVNTGDNLNNTDTNTNATVNFGDNYRGMAASHVTKRVSGLAPPTWFFRLITNIKDIFSSVNRIYLTAAVFLFVTFILPAQSFAFTLKENILSIVYGDTWGEIAKYFMQPGEQLWGEKGRAIETWRQLFGAGQSYGSMDYIQAGQKIDVFKITEGVKQVAPSISSQALTIPRKPVTILQLVPSPDFLTNHPWVILAVAVGIAIILSIIAVKLYRSYRAGKAEQKVKKTVETEGKKETAREAVGLTKEEAEHGPAEEKDRLARETAEKAAAEEEARKKSGQQQERVKGAKVGKRSFDKIISLLTAIKSRWQEVKRSGAVKGFVNRYKEIARKLDKLSKAEDEEKLTKHVQEADNIAEQVEKAGLSKTEGITKAEKEFRDALAAAKQAIEADKARKANELRAAQEKGTAEKRVEEGSRDDQKAPQAQGSQEPVVDAQAVDAQIAGKTAPEELIPEATPQEEPSSAEDYVREAKVRLESGEYDKAIELAKEAVKHKPDFLEAYYILRKAYEKKGEYRKALRIWRIEEMSAFNKKCEVTDYIARGKFDIGMYYFQMGDEAEAITRFKEAVQAIPELIINVPEKIRNQVKPVEEKTSSPISDVLALPAVKFSLNRETIIFNRLLTSFLEFVRNIFPKNHIERQTNASVSKTKADGTEIHLPLGPPSPYSAAPVYSVYFKKEEPNGRVSIQEEEPRFEGRTYPIERGTDTQEIRVSLVSYSKAGGKGNKTELVGLHDLVIATARISKAIRNYLTYIIYAGLNKAPPCLILGFIALSLSYPASLIPAIFALSLLFILNKLNHDNSTQPPIISRILTVAGISLGLGAAIVVYEGLTGAPLQGLTPLVEALITTILENLTGSITHLTQLLFGPSVAGNPVAAKVDLGGPVTPITSRGLTLMGLLRQLIIGGVLCVTLSLRNSALTTSLNSPEIQLYLLQLEKMVTGTLDYSLLTRLPAMSTPEMAVLILGSNLLAAIAIRYLRGLLQPETATSPLIRSMGTAEAPNRGRIGASPVSSSPATTRRQFIKISLAIAAAIGFGFPSVVKSETSPTWDPLLKAENLYNASIKALQEKQFERAIELSNQALKYLEQSPESKSKNRLLGNILNNVGNIYKEVSKERKDLRHLSKKAEECYKESIKADPENRDSCLELARIYAARADKTYYETLARLPYPKEITMFRNITVNQTIENYEKAIEHYQRFGYAEEVNIFKLRIQELKSQENWWFRKSYNEIEEPIKKLRDFCDKEGFELIVETISGWWPILKIESKDFKVTVIDIIGIVFAGGRAYIVAMQGVNKHYDRGYLELGPGKIRKFSEENVPQEVKDLLVKLYKSSSSPASASPVKIPERDTKQIFSLSNKVYEKAEELFSKAAEAMKQKMYHDAFSLYEEAAMYIELAIKGGITIDGEKVAGYEYIFSTVIDDQTLQIALDNNSEAEALGKKINLGIQASIHQLVADLLLEELNDDARLIGDPDTIAEFRNNIVIPRVLEGILKYYAGLGKYKDMIISLIPRVATAIWLKEKQALVSKKTMSHAKKMKILVDLINARLGNVISNRRVSISGPEHLNRRLESDDFKDFIKQTPEALKNKIQDLAKESFGKKFEATNGRRGHINTIRLTAAIAYLVLTDEEIGDLYRELRHASSPATTSAIEVNLLRNYHSKITRLHKTLVPYYWLFFYTKVLLLAICGVGIFFSFLAREHLIITSSWAKGHAPDIFLGFMLPNAFDVILERRFPKFSGLKRSILITISILCGAYLYEVVGSNDWIDFLVELPGISLFFLVNSLGVISEAGRQCKEEAHKNLAGASSPATLEFVSSPVRQFARRSPAALGAILRTKGKSYRRSSVNGVCPGYEQDGSVNSPIIERITSSSILRQGPPGYKYLMPQPSSLLSSSPAEETLLNRLNRQQILPLLIASLLMLNTCALPKIIGQPSYSVNLAEYRIKEIVFDELNKRITSWLAQYDSFYGLPYDFRILAEIAKHSGLKGFNAYLRTFINNTSTIEEKVIQSYLER